MLVPYLRYGLATALGSLVASTPIGDEILRFLVTPVDAVNENVLDMSLPLLTLTRAVIVGANADVNARLALAVRDD